MAVLVSCFKATKWKKNSDFVAFVSLNVFRTKYAVPEPGHCSSSPGVPPGRLTDL